MDIRKSEELEEEMDGVEQQIPPELIQLAGVLLQAFLSGDRESVEALYEMYHEPDKYVERQRDALKEMLRELMADGKITAEEAQQIQQEIDQSGDNKLAGEQAVQTPPANDEMAIPENQQRSVNPRGKTLHEIMGIAR
jgi:peptidoglycan hydrolase CwlO-like protein